MFGIIISRQVRESNLFIRQRFTICQSLCTDFRESLAKVREESAK